MAKPWAAWLWLAGAGAGVLLLLQGLLGGPIRKAADLPSFEAGQVVEQVLPHDTPRSRWYLAEVRLRSPAGPVPLYRSEEALRAAGRPGFSVREKRLFLLRPLEGAGPWVLSYPWVPPGWLLLVAAALAVAGGAQWLRPAPSVRWLSPPGSAAGVALALLAGAIALRVSGFSFPCWSNDTRSHYDSVFAVALGHAPSTTADRPFGLPMVMGTLLRWIPDLRVVVAAQGFAMLAAASAIGLILWKSRRRLATVPWVRAVAGLLAVLAFAALAFNESVLEQEWTLLAESWVAFYLSLQIVLVWYLTSRVRAPGRMVVAYAAFCLTGFLAFFTRPNWGLALALLPLPWVVAAALRARGLRLLGWLAAGAALTLLVAGPLFAWQNHCRRLAGASALYERARAMVCWHVPLIRLEIDRRLAATPPDPQRPLLLGLAQVMDTELARARTLERIPYATIGYDADNLYWTTLEEASGFRQLPVEERTTLCFALFRGALLHHPGLYAQKLARQAPRFLFHPYASPAISLRHIEGDLEQSITMAREEPLIPPAIAQRYAATLVQAQAEFHKPWPSPARLALSLRGTVLVEWLNASFGWTVGLSLAVCLAAALWRPWRAAVPWAEFRPPLCVAIWSLGSSALSALTAALVQGLDVQRYLDLFTPLMVLSQALWPLLACALLLCVARGRRRAAL